MSGGLGGLEVWWPGGGLEAWEACRPEALEAWRPKDLGGLEAFWLCGRPGGLGGLASVGSLVRGDRTSDLREIFRFAHPEQIIIAGQVYDSDVH